MLTLTLTNIARRHLSPNSGSLWGSVRQPLCPSVQQRWRGAGDSVLKDGTQKQLQSRASGEDPWCYQSGSLCPTRTSLDTGDQRHPSELSLHVHSFTCFYFLYFSTWLTSNFFCLQYTISGKKVEVAVKQVIAGKDVTQRGAFSNPDSLDLYKNLPELLNFWALTWGTSELLKVLRFWVPSEGSDSTCWTFWRNS